MFYIIHLNHNFGSGAASAGYPPKTFGSLKANNPDPGT